MTPSRRRIQSKAVRAVAFLFWVGAWALAALTVADILPQVLRTVYHWRFSPSVRNIEDVVTYAALLLQVLVRDLSRVIFALAFSRGILWAWEALGHLRTLAGADETGE